MRESGVTPERVLDLIRKNGVQEIGAQIRRALEPGEIVEPVAPKKHKKIRTRL